MFFECRQGLARELFHVGIFAFIGFILKLFYVLFMVADRVTHILAIEFGARELRELVHGGFVFFIQVGRELHALVGGYFLELIVGLAMILFHALAELLHLVVGCLILSNFSELDFHHSTLSRFFDERGI